MFEFNSKIRFSETDEESKLTILSLLNYFQDCSTFHSESVGDTVKSQQNNSNAWVLVKWHVEINRMPSFYEDVVIGTVPYRIHRCSGMRNYYMKTAQGEMLAYADTTWALIDTKSMNLITVSDEIKSLYPDGEKLEMPKVDRRIKYEGEPVMKTSVAFSAADQDSNHHVNNVKTVSAAWNLISGDKKFTRMRTEFRKQLFGGDEINACVYRDENRHIVTFENSDGEVTTVCEFTAE